VVRRNDTFWKIAERQLGDAHLWKRILKANPGIRKPKDLRRGMVIRIPVADTGLPAGRMAGGAAGPDREMSLNSPAPPE
jgi:hypothetical protein